MISRDPNQRVSFSECFARIHKIQQRWDLGRKIQQDLVDLSTELSPSLNLPAFHSSSCFAFSYVLRTAELHRLWDEYHKESSNLIVMSSATPSVGKTLLALHLAYSLKGHVDVIWISASTITHDLRECSRQLQLCDEDMTGENIRYAMSHWISTRKSKYLFVLDEASDPDGLAEKFARDLAGRGRVLITTSCGEEWAKTSRKDLKVAHLRVSDMTATEIWRLFVQGCPSADDYLNLPALVEKTFNNPTVAAVAAVGMQLDGSRCMNFAECKSALDDVEIPEIDEERTVRSQATDACVMMIRSMANEAKMKLMFQLALLKPGTPIPRVVLLIGSGGNGDGNDGDHADDDDKKTKSNNNNSSKGDDLWNAIDLLGGSLTCESRLVRMNRLLCWCMQRIMTIDNLLTSNQLLDMRFESRGSRRKTSSFGSGAESLPSYQMEDWVVSESYDGQVWKLVDVFLPFLQLFDDKDPETWWVNGLLAPHVAKMAKTMKKRGHLARTARPEHSRAPPDGWKAVSELLRLLGNIETLQVHYVNALFGFELCLWVLENRLGRHVIVAKSLLNAGKAHCNLRNPTQGVEYYRKALKIHEDILGKGHRDTGDTHMYLGMAFEITGDIVTAQQHWEEALRVWSAWASARNECYDHWVEMLVGAGRLAMLLADYDRSLELFQKASSIVDDKLNGDKSPLKPVVLRGFAQLDMATQRYDDARLKLESTVKCLMGLPGGKVMSLEVATTLETLARVLTDLQQPQDAWRVGEKATHIRDVIFGRKAVER